MPTENIMLEEARSNLLGQGARPVFLAGVESSLLELKTPKGIEIYEQDGSGYRLRSILDPETRKMK